MKTEEHKKYYWFVAYYATNSSGQLGFGRGGAITSTPIFHVRDFELQNAPDAIDVIVQNFFQVTKEQYDEL